jgi:hypothetical protein
MNKRLFSHILKTSDSVDSQLVIPCISTFMVKNIIFFYIINKFR